MTSWDWFDEFELQAQLQGDRARLHLSQLQKQAYRFRERDPDHALALLAQGRSLAERLGEPWWILYYDQQRVHALLHFKQDYRDVLSLAIRNTLTLRKPAYAAYPRPLLIHGDLVSAYLGIDPRGYADRIQQALDYLDEQTAPEGDERYLLLGSQRQFALECARLHEALQFSYRSLELAATDPDSGRARHFLVFTYSGLCEIAWRKGDWDLLQESATAGEVTAHLVGHQVELAGFWMWLALLHRHHQDESKATNYYLRAQRTLSGLGMPPDSSFRDAECAFHEHHDRLDLALQAREAELFSLRGRGRLASECTCLFHRAAYLHRLGRLTSEELIPLRAVAAQLRDPDPVLRQIERLERGELP